MATARLFSADLRSSYGNAVDVADRDDFVRSVSGVAKRYRFDGRKTDGTGVAQGAANAPEIRTSYYASPRQELRDLPAPWARVVPTAKRFIVLQAWTGVVLKVELDSYFVRLYDDMRKDKPAAETWIKASEVDLNDVHLAIEGAVFYWNIGYNDAGVGRERTSIVRFRRTPQWSRHDAAAAKNVSERLLGFFKEDETISDTGELKPDSSS